jgi:AraC-like DNA-binding protein
MWYETELRFMQSMLNKVNLQFLLLTKEKLPENPPDLGIRKFLGRESEYRHMFCELPFEASQNTIYKMTDTYLCNYLYLMLPGESPTVLMVGPYMLLQLTHQQLLQEAERYSVPPQLFNEMENYFCSIPVYSDESFLFAIINSFAEVLWGGSEAFTVVKLNDEQIFPSPFSQEANPIPPEKTLLTMEDMERRYAYENEAIRAVSLGMTHKAELMFSSINQLAIKQRVADPLRNIKNYCIIMNTLMRKAAEQGSVHPLYLDSVSSEFARRIEITGSTTAGYKLMAEMLSTYCRLVKKHSMTTYSLPIRKTLVCIDANLSGDLSLHTLAAMQNISSGYLSALFKKELGQTLTDYVNQRRMKQAKQLLNSTVLQVQTIAQYCGIPDVNYFSKTFKRYCGCTPKDFRQSQQTYKETAK